MDNSEGWPDEYFFEEDCKKDFSKEGEDMRKEYMKILCKQIMRREEVVHNLIEAHYLDVFQVLIDRGLPRNLAIAVQTQDMNEELKKNREHLERDLDHFNLN